MISRPLPPPAGNVASLRFRRCPLHYSRGHLRGSPCRAHAHVIYLGAHSRFCRVPLKGSLSAPPQGLFSHSAGFPLLRGDRWVASLFRDTPPLLAGGGPHRASYALSLLHPPGQPSLPSFKKQTVLVQRAVQFLVTCFATTVFHTRVPGSFSHLLLFFEFPFFPPRSSLGGSCPH